MDGDERSKWGSIRYTDLIGGGMLVLLILYSAMKLKRSGNRALVENSG